MIKLKPLLTKQSTITESKTTISIGGKSVKFNVVPTDNNGFAFIGPDLFESPEIVKSLKSHCESKLKIECDRDNSYKGAGIAFTPNIYDILKKL
jgi:hypothetical protein